jgi:hypothetical protein
MSENHEKNMLGFETPRSVSPEPAGVKFSSVITKRTYNTNSGNVISGTTVEHRPITNGNMKPRNYQIPSFQTNTSNTAPLNKPIPPTIPILSRFIIIDGRTVRDVVAFNKLNEIQENNMLTSQQKEEQKQLVYKETEAAYEEYKRVFSHRRYGGTRRRSNRKSKRKTKRHHARRT